jgi:hypothetical protein
LGNTQREEAKMITKEAICSKCGETYNPEQFGDLHYSNDCNGSPINEIEIGSTTYEPKHISPEQLAKVISIINTQKEEAN